MVLTDGTQWAGANAIAISGTNVYVAGYEYSSSGKSIAKYWKNGQAVSLTDGSNDGVATAMLVDGSNVYVVGTESNTATFRK